MSRQARKAAQAKTGTLQIDEIGLKGTVSAGRIHLNIPVKNLGSSAVSSQLVVSTADRQYLYVVVETKVVTPDHVEVLDPTDQAIVTMLTYVPDGIYSHRLVVRAEAV